VGKAQRAHAQASIMSHYRRSLTPGASYFFTVALADRRSDMLVTQIDLLRQSYRNIVSQYPFETVAICILPDHLHAIWTLPMGDADFSTRWQLIKSGFSRHLPASDGRSASKALKREKGIWQRRFWEHQICDDDDMQNHVEYIHYNPVKHGLVSQVRDWQYSSFHRYVSHGTYPADWAGNLVERGGYGERA
jgi:putative transposase